MVWILRSGTGRPGRTIGQVVSSNIRQSGVEGNVTVRADFFV